MSSFLPGVETEEDFLNTMQDESKYCYLAAPLRNVLTLLSRCDQQDARASVTHTQASITLKETGFGR